MAPSAGSWLRCSSGSAWTSLIYLRELPGFSLNLNDIGIASRGGLNRVSGTAVYPIELGVVAGMLLPLAVYLAIYDTKRRTRRRWAAGSIPVLAIPASISRSAVLSVAVALGVLVVLMPSLSSGWYQFWLCHSAWQPSS